MPSSLSPKPSPLRIFNCAWEKNIENTEIFLPAQLKMHTLNAQRERPGTETKRQILKSYGKFMTQHVSLVIHWSLVHGGMWCEGFDNTFQ